MKEMTTHSFCLALCPRLTLLLPSRTQTSGSAAVTGSLSLKHVGCRQKGDHSALRSKSFGNS